LYLFGGICMAITGIVAIVRPSQDLPLFAGVILIAFSSLQLILGRAIQRLQKTARIVAGVIAIPGLIAFPIGTLINAVVAYLMFSKKGATVFSDDYKRIIAETPHIKYTTSIVVWIVLGIFALVVLVGLVLAVFATFAPKH
jgi:hypothetical protein